MKKGSLPKKKRYKLYGLENNKEHLPEELDP
jgi:hypothetical protein